MSMTNSAASAQPTTTTPTTVETPTASPAKAPEKKTTNQPKVTPIKRTWQELMQELSNLNGDWDLWHLTYMLHTREVIVLKEQEAENRLPCKVNSFCARKKPLSVLEYASRCVAELDAGYHYYSNTYTFSGDTLATKCAGCTFEGAFCPHKAAAYIEHVCENNQLDKENVYHALLGNGYVKKPSFAKFCELNIPREAYEFIDMVSATAAAELLKLKLIQVSANVDDRIAYSYYPLCEPAARGHFEPIMTYYRSKNGKTDFIRKVSLRDEIGENRNCSGCIFPQCPDKVAAYFIHLAVTYGVDVMEVAEYIITKQKIEGVSRRGNFRYYHNLRKVDEIPFTPESALLFKDIARYIINRFTVKDAKVPLIPFNMVIYSRDEKSADDAVEVFRDFLHYYNYYTKLKGEEFNFAEGGLEALVKKVKVVESPTVLHVKQMELLSSSLKPGMTDFKVGISQLVHAIESKRNLLCFVVSGEKVKLDMALSAYPEFYEGVMNYHLTISDMPGVKIMQEILSQLRAEYELEEGFEQALEYYVISKYGESNLKSKAFIEYVVQTVVFNHYNKEINTDKRLLIKDVPLASNRRSDDEIWADLNALTGLDNVKTEFLAVDQLLKYQKKLASLGHKVGSRPNMHMVFSGNPGTGKTTVARLIAEMLYNVGFIKQNKLVETSPKDLVAQYIGHTAPKTAAVCESAYGGVLFIDEAYELSATGNGNGTDQFRAEAVTELIKQMEDNRDRLIVILAGYTEDMQKLMDTNAGFASRIGKVIEFEDYTVEQLMDMFMRTVYKNGMRIDDAAKAKVQSTIASAKDNPNFGNGRYVRSLYERVIMEHAKNTVGIDEEDALIEIRAADIPSV